MERKATTSDQDRDRLALQVTIPSSRPSVVGRRVKGQDWTSRCLKMRRCEEISFGGPVILFRFCSSFWSRLFPFASLERGGKSRAEPSMQERTEMDSETT